MSFEKRFRQDLEKYATPSAESLGLRRVGKAATRRKLMTAPIAIALAVIMIVGVAAGVPALVKLFNDDVIIDHGVQLTEVPKGYVGIYTVEDLVKLAKDVDNDCEAENYILMADITFTDADYDIGGICEGGWKPINYDVDRYMRISDNAVFTYDEIKDEYLASSYDFFKKYGQTSPNQCNIELFNGNGYTISNLKIDADITPRDPNVDIYIGLFGLASGTQIINLGIDGMEVNLRGTPKSSYNDIFVGGIVGYGDYVGASYIKDFELNAALSDIILPELDISGEFERTIELNVGGIAGRANYIDACYSEAFDFDISATGEKGLEVLAGGIVSRLNNICASSWADGEFAVSGEGILIDDHEIITPKTGEIMVPTVMTEAGYEIFKQKLTEKYGSFEEFDAVRVWAYYTKKSIDRDDISERERDELKVVLDKWNKYYSMATGNEEYHETLYIYDPTASAVERRRVEEILSDAFGSEQAYIEFCQENTLTAGVRYGATIQGGTDGRTEDDYPGFDFEKLWMLVDGVPRLKIFQNN